MTVSEQQSRARASDHAVRGAGPPVPAGANVRPKWGGRLLRTAVTVAFIALLLHLVHLGDLARLVTSARPVPLLIALVVLIADRFVMVGKWMPLLRVQVPDARWFPALRAYLGSGVAQYLLPSTVGADAVRAAAVGRSRQTVAEVAASIVAERLLGLSAGGVLACIALILAIHADLPLGSLLPWALAAFGVSVGVTLIPLVPGLAGWVERLARRGRLPRGFNFVFRLSTAYQVYRRRPAVLAMVGLLSVGEQWFPIANLWLCAIAVGVHLSFTAAVVTMPLTLFVTRLPLSIGGLGVGEGAMVYLLGLFGVPVTAALAVSVLCRAVDVVVMVLPGMVFWNGIVADIRRRPAGTTPAG
ncbi:MAG TPA: lysylphosphatidylglycerol synthase transmembrane domain-containing protein [Gemmatimonadales bacterium]|nr:lysylphosphatidylglycerol synthase transmembrane domain-containing protein [Gemmatimonadales bacterium]